MFGLLHRFTQPVVATSLHVAFVSCSGKGDEAICYVLVSDESPSRNNLVVDWKSVGVGARSGISGSPLDSETCEAKKIENLLAVNRKLREENERLEARLAEVKQVLECVEEDHRASLVKIFNLRSQVDGLAMNENCFKENPQKNNVFHGCAEL